jgi:hypothetical protein
VKPSDANKFTYKIGDVVTLMCDTGMLTLPGNPAPTKVQWRKDGTDAGSDAQLTFTATTIDQTGEYSCRVGNDYGDSQYSDVVTITIEGKAWHNIMLIANSK